MVAFAAAVAVGIAVSAAVAVAIVVVVAVLVAVSVVVVVVVAVVFCSGVCCWFSLGCCLSLLLVSWLLFLCFWFWVASCKLSVAHWLLFSLGLVLSVCCVLVSVWVMLCGACCRSHLTCYLPVVVCRLDLFLLFVVCVLC